MAKIINLIFVLFLYTNALAQIGGTRATTDTMRLADKFAVYKIALGQRLDASKANTDTIQVTALLDVPEGGLPTCEASRQGNLMMNTSNNRLYFCNGTSWGLVAYDADLDGLTSAIDANEAVAFTAGTAAASNVMSGFTFYTGAGMTETTGSIPTYGGALSNGGSISSGSYTPANFPFTLQTDDDYVDKDLTINNPTNLAASNVRIGVAIAGNTGTYPSSGNRLNGNTGTTDVTAATLLEANEGFQSDGTLVTGTMPNNGAGSFSADGGYAAGYYSSINVDVVVSGTADTDAGGGQILSGYEAWNSTGGLVDGTMPDNGSANFDTDGAKSAGYYSGITVDVIHPGTGDVNASGAQILTGYEAWSELGDLVDGTMPNRGSVTFDTDGVKNTGYYSGIEVDVIHPGTGDTNAGGAQILTGYEAWSELGDLVDGTMPDNGAGNFGADGGYAAGYYSSITVDVVAAGTADTDAGGGQILSGYEAWGSTGSLIDGTMPNRGAPTFTTDDVSLDAGYYSGGTISIIDAGTADTDAGGAQILTGYEAWNSTGSVVDGTMPNRGSPTFNTDDVSLDAGYYSGGTISVIDAGTADTDASGAQILSGYEAWDTNGSVVDGTMANNAGGNFTSDGSYSAGYYSSINVDVIESGTGTTDAGDAQVRQNYEYWTSSGQRRTGTISDQGGSNNSPIVGTGSYTVATGSRYLTGNVTINRVSATKTINHGESSGDGPWRSVSCNSATVESHSGISGARDTAEGNVRSGENYYGTSDGSAFTARTGSMPDRSGGTFSASEGTSGSDLLVSAGGYLTGDVRVNKCDFGYSSSLGGISGQTSVSMNNGQEVTITADAGSQPTARYKCDITCPATGFGVSGPTTYPTTPPGTNIPSGQFITITANGGSQSAAEYHCL